MASEISKEEASRIFEQHSQYVYRVSLLLSKSESLADDITQETFLKIFKNYHKYDPTKPIEPWIYSITVNTFRNLYRKQKWLNFFGTTPEKGTEVNTVEQSILQEEQNQELRLGIEHLSSKNREVIVLYYFAELKINEIASVLDIPIGTCKSRLNRAVNELRRELSNNNIQFRKERPICEKL